MNHCKQKHHLFLQPKYSLADEGAKISSGLHSLHSSKDHDKEKNEDGGLIGNQDLPSFVTGEVSGLSHLLYACLIGMTPDLVFSPKITI